MDKAHIMVVDDDPEIQKVVSKYLTEDGHTVYPAMTGEDSLQLLQKKKIDLILLDMMLPDSDGLTLMAQYRNKDKIPIIVVSGKGDTTDRIVGLEMGADDYLTKPFHMRELSARIRSVLRRAADDPALSPESGSASVAQDGAVIAFGEWIMDCARFEVRHKTGDVVPLTSGEFKLLHALVQAPGRVLTREQLFELTRGEDYGAYDRAVDIQVGRLRKKLGDDPRAPSLIKTVRGIGYIFIAQTQHKAAS
ncbi:MAG: response regulator [Rhodospirillales bacterium]|nr:response regulator [Rhodospirillales bacterium]